MTRARRKLLDAVKRDGFAAVRWHARTSDATLYGLLNGTRATPRLETAHQLFIAYEIAIDDWFSEAETNSHL